MKRKSPPDKTDVHVGQRVRQARIMLGMSQEKLAAPLNISFQQVQKYEKGTNRIGASRLQQIATILRRPVAWFFEGTVRATDLLDGPPVDDPLAALGATCDGLALARAFNAIHDSMLRLRAVQLIEAIAAVTDRDLAKRAA